MPEIVSDIVDVYVYRDAPGGVEFLLLQRAAHSILGGTWQAVHGHGEGGETAFETAQRELKEETGLLAAEWYQLERVNTFFIARRDEIHLSPGFAARVAADDDPVLNSEHAAFRWLPPDQARATFHWPGQRQAVQDILEWIIGGGAAGDSLRLTPD